MPLESAFKPLVGAWTLRSLWRTYSDTGERVESFGPNPNGRMVLDAGGRIMFLLMRRDRPVPLTDADHRELFTGMMAYTGHVRSDGPGRLITTVDLAWQPTWAGDLLRFYELAGDILKLSTPENRHPAVTGRPGRTELEWVREQST